jgi:hypothetical protein
MMLGAIDKDLGDSENTQGYLGGPISMDGGERT